MPSKETEKYTEALSNFSDAIQNLVDAIKEQVSNNTNKDSTKDIIAENSPIYEQILEISESITTIKKTSEKTHENTVAILNKINELKTEKKDDKKSMFDKLTFSDQREGLFQGIKAIVMMAGAILAVGTAFKVIGGDIDLKTVIALSIALPAMGMAFSTVADEKLKIKDVLTVGAAFVIMAGSLVITSTLLNNVTPISFGQMIGISVAALTAGVAMSIMGGTLFLLDLMGVNNIGDWSNLPIYATSAAGSLFLISEIFNSMTIPSIDPMALGKYSVAVGASLIAMGLTAKVFSILGVNIPTMVKGGLAMVAAAGTLWLTSLILNEGSYDNYPTLDWALGAGVSISTFGLIAFGMGGIITATAGIGALALAIGLVSTIGVASSLVVVDKILASGSFNKYPSFDWAMGAGLSISTFGMAAMGLGTYIMATLGLGAVAISTGLETVEKIAHTMNKVGGIISTGNYSGGPDADWGKGVGYAISAFAEALSVFKPGIKDAIMSFFGVNIASGQQNMQMIVNIARLMPEVASIIGTGDYSGGPDADWGKGVGYAISAFAEALSVFKPGIMDAIMTFFGNKANTGAQNIQMIKRIAELMPEVAAIVGTGDYSSGPDADWGKAIGTSVTSFATAIATLDDELSSADSVYLWINPMKAIAGLIAYYGDILKGKTFNTTISEGWSDSVSYSVVTFSEMLSDATIVENMQAKLMNSMLVGTLIPYYGSMMKGINFSLYPTEQWTDGIINFIENMMGLDINSEGISAQVSGIYTLSNAFFDLAHSVSALAKSMQNISSAPPLSEIYKGIVLLSLIDAKRLSNVMNTINGTQTSLATTTNAVSGGGAKDDTAGILGSVKSFFGGVVNAFTGGSASGDNAKTDAPTDKAGSKKTTIVNPVIKTNNLLEQILKEIKDQGNKKPKDNTETKKSSFVD